MEISNFKMTLLIELLSHRNRSFQANEMNIIIDAKGEDDVFVIMKKRSEILITKTIYEKSNSSKIN